MDPSGIRFGTPAMTTRGMKDGEATKVAELMVARLNDHTSETKAQELKAEVETLCAKFPIPEVMV
jgi:glycine hydroxymethyltransferase